MRRSLALFIVLLFSLSACLKSVHEDGSGLSSEEGDLPTDISELEKLATDLLATNCNSCHGSQSSGYGGINYMDDVQAMLDNGLVIPGNPSASLLYSETASGDMPLSGHIGDQNVAVLEQWIYALEEDETDDDPGAPTVAKTFTEINTSIIQPKCAICHNAMATIPLIDYTSIMNLVWINNPAASLLWESPDDGRMPSSGPLLSQQELDDIASWINDGAPDN